MSLDTTSPVHSENPTERARRILHSLPGKWTFTLGGTSGTRELKLLYPGYVVEWSEEFDGHDIEGRGFIGYDATQDSFFSMTVHNRPGEYDFMMGQLRSTEDAIEFESPHSAPGTRPFKSIFRLRSSHRFTYTALVMGEDEKWEEAWTAVFERQA